MAQTEKAGVHLVKRAGPTFWDPYAGYFQDPDGHLWEIAWNPQLLPDAWASHRCSRSPLQAVSMDTSRDRAETLDLLSRHQIFIDLQDAQGYAGLYVTDGRYESPFGSARGTEEILADTIPVSSVYATGHIVMNCGKSMRTGGSLSVSRPSMPLDRPTLCRDRGLGETGRHSAGSLLVA